MSGALPVHVTLRAFFGPAYTGLPFSAATGTTLPLTIEARNSVTGQLVDVVGLRVLPSRPDGANLPLDGDEIGRVAAGRYVAEIFVGAPGDWTLRVECDEPRPAETVAWLRASGPPVAVTGLGTGGGQQIGLPGNQPYDFTVLEDVPEASEFDGSEELLLAQKDALGVRQPRGAPIQRIRDDAMAAIAPQVAQVDGDAQATEAGRAQVEAIRDALPGDVEAEITQQAPGLISEAVAAEVAAPAALAQTARSAAEMARDAALAQANIAADKAAGVASGKPFFSTPGSGETAAILWRATGGDAVEFGRLASQAALDAKPIVKTESVPDIGFGARDDLGFLPLNLTPDGLTLRVPGGTLQLRPDGAWRLSRSDGSAPIELRPDGMVSLGGLSFVVSPDGAIAILDALGFVALRIRADGSVDLGGLRYAVVDGTPTVYGADGTVVMRFPPGLPPVFTGAGGGGGGGATIDSTERDYVIADDLRFVALGINKDGSPSKPGPGLIVQQGWTADELAARDNRNLATVSARARQREDFLYRPTRAFNAFISLGQSFAADEYGWPHVTQTNRFPGLLMLGNSIAPSPAINNSVDFVPRGAAVLNPLVGTTDNKSAPTVLSEAEILALDRVNASNWAEGVHPGALAFFRQGWNDRFGVADDAARKWVAGALGFGGMPLESLSKPDPSGRYTRPGDFLTKVRNLTGPDLGLAAVFDLQGEANYARATFTDGTRAEASKDGYKAIKLQYVADHRADYQTGLLGQARPFPWISYQTGGIHTKNDFDMGVGMAQWELSDELLGFYLACPHYFMPKNGTHPTGNSYRWLGQHFGKVLVRVLLDGMRWRPLCPISVTGAAVLRDREILLDLHVPHPPLVWDIPYVTTSDVPNKGFSVVDGTGQSRTIAINSVEIVGSTMVRLTLNRRPDLATARLRYADETKGGMGALRDSDPTVANELFVYQPERNAHPNDNVPALIGKPYPLHNWCVGFSIPLVQG